SDEADPRSLGFSDQMLAAVDAEVRRIIEECFARAKELLTEHRDKLEAIVAALLEKETLDEEEVYAAAGIPRAAAPSTDHTMPGAARHGLPASTGGAKGTPPACDSGLGLLGILLLDGLGVLVDPVEGLGDGLLPVAVQALPLLLAHLRGPALVLGPVVDDVLLTAEEPDRDAGGVGRAEGGRLGHLRAHDVDTED